MIILGLPILFYLIGFVTICLASRWWTFIPVSAVVFAAEWRFWDVGSGDGIVATTATTMLLLAVLGTAAGFVTRATLLLSGGAALRGRGLMLTLIVFVSVPLAYGFMGGGRQTTQRGAVTARPAARAE